ncbi:hypothetical protein SAMN02194393_03460 [Maledivibacter halophilus]|uniref:Uncharacterized protein n=2 Tax=Maledivibacter halophilus TaxID=36842 RepID=A0A1T5LW39_9FIRM|nr:hypothetical protein SAMN02194393_02149 [Maledivibacter halophilus]SKC71643.1 hypothetical protein SAMN02194393_02503 [Maledivibacter halophilus]SKC80220.1 hypothetical protein SAMN02194393_03460 [Maledivibacter halophilus]
MQGTITNVLLNVVLGLVTLGGAYATLYIQRATKKVKIETQRIEEEKQRDILWTALDRLEDVAFKTVNKIEEVSAKNLRQLVKGGKIDKEKLEDLAVVAYNEIIDILEPEYLDALESTLGDAETYILNTIEEKVKKVKDLKEVPHDL